MPVLHESSLTSDVSLSRLQVASTDDFLALPHSHCGVIVWNLLNLSATTKLQVIAFAQYFVRSDEWVRAPSYPT